MKIISALILCWIGLQLVGCRSVESPNIRFGLENLPAKMDPRFATDATSSRINRLLYSRLVEFDEAFKPQPGIANWQAITPRHYRFVLREPRPAFWEGSVLNAKDVVATYMSVLDPATGSPHKASLDMISSMVATDERTVDFFLTRDEPLFPAFLVIGILPASAIERGQSLIQNPMGSGPLRFVEKVGDEKILLQRRADEQVIELVHVGAPEVRVLKLLRGEIDMLQNDLLPELEKYLSEHKGVVTDREKGTNYAYIGFNFHDAVTGNPAIREAITYGIDRASIIHYLLGGIEQSAIGIFPPEHWVSDPTLQAFPYDPKKAKEILHGLGYSASKRLSITYKTSTNPLRVRIASVIKQQLAEIGIDVELRTYDWGTFYGDIKSGNFQMYSLAWVGIKTPDFYDYVFHSSRIPPNGANRGRLENSEIDKLIETASQVDTLERRVPVYQQLQARLHAILPFVPLWYEDHFFAARDNIRGYALDLEGSYDALLTVEKKPGKVR